MSLVPLAVRSTVLVLTFVPRLYRTPEFFKVFEASGWQACLLYTSDADDDCCRV